MNVTGEEVKQAMIAANITKVDHHECGVCGVMVCYQRQNESLFFDSSCDCSRVYYPPARRLWADAANWINMQSTPDVRNQLRAKFGLSPE